VIQFYSGTPGSGKSFHMAKDIIFALRTRRKNVISTVNVDLNLISKNGRKKLGEFTYIPIVDLTPEMLYRYAFKNHVKGKEGQTLLIIDECQIIFNPREYQRNNRAEWILFFTKHRHLGYSIIMTSQFDRLVDRQIRSLFEYEIKHRKVNNMGILFLLPFTAFVMIEYWYGVRLVIGKRFMLFRKSTAAIYDSYVMYDDFAKEYAQPDEDAATKDDVPAEADGVLQNMETTPIDDTQQSTVPEAAAPEMGAGGPHRREGRARYVWFAGVKRWFMSSFENAPFKKSG